MYIHIYTATNPVRKEVERETSVISKMTSMKTNISRNPKKRLRLLLKQLREKKLKKLNHKNLKLSPSKNTISQKESKSALSSKKFQSKKEKSKQSGSKKKN